MTRVESQMLIKSTQEKGHIMDTRLPTALVLLLILCGGCRSLVNIQQRYPAEYSALTLKQATDIVKQSFSPSDEASGLVHFGLEVLPKDANDYVITADGVTVKAVLGITYTDSKGTPLYDGPPLESHPKLYGKPSGIYYYILKMKEVTWRFSELQAINVEATKMDLFKEWQVRRPYGDYAVMFYKSGIRLQVSKENCPRLLLALSKLAPQAKIHTFYPVSLPTKINIQ